MEKRFKRQCVWRGVGWALFLASKLNIFQNLFKRFSNKGLSFILICSLLFEVPLMAAEPLSIPAELGDIEDHFQGTSGKTIIFIQDAHDFLEVQENIAKIIRLMVERYGVRTVFEEGYEGEVPSDEYFGFMPLEVKERVSYFLMDKLRLGGAEYAHINRRKDFQLIGADSFDLHRKNVEWYRRNMECKDETKEELFILKNEIEKLAHLYLPKKMKEWMKLKERFGDGMIDIEEYLKRTDFGKELLEGLPSMNGKKFFEEVYRLEDQFMADEVPPREKQILHYWQSLRLLQGLNEIQMIPAEYEAVQGRLRNLNTERLAEFIAAHTKAPIVLSRKWEKNIRNSLQFYRTAREREFAAAARLKAFAKSDQKTAVLVFGGFHQAEIVRFLRQNNFSYWIVSPKITSPDPLHQAYYRKLMGRKNSLLKMPPLLAGAAPPLRSFELAKLGGAPSRAEFREQIFRLSAAVESILEKNKAKDLSLENFLWQVEAGISRSEMRAFPFVDWKERETKLETMWIEEAFRQTKGNLLQAAKRLKINRNTLFKKAQFYKIDPRQYASVESNGAVEIPDLKQTLEEAFKKAALEALALTGGNLVNAAKLLKINRNTLRKRMDDLKIGFVPAEEPALSASRPLRSWKEREKIYKAMEKAYVLDAVKESGGNKTEAARRTGMNRNTLSKILAEYSDSESSLPPVKNLNHWPSLQALSQNFRKDFLTAALIFYRGNASKLEEQIGIDRNTIANWIKEMNMELAVFKKRPAAELIFEYAKEIGRAFDEAEKLELVEKFRREIFEKDRKDLRLLADALGDRAVSPLYLQKYESIAEQAEQTQKHFVSLWSDEELIRRTQSLKGQVAEGPEKFEALMPEAFAIFKETVLRKAKMELSRSQVLAALSILHNHAVEMEPGEGKTLSIALAAFFSALTGKGVHIHTFNDYLARRDAEETGRIFSFLGMSVGVRVKSDEEAFLFDGESGRLRPLKKREAYQADITYGEKDQFVFDFLHDQSVLKKERRLQRKEAPELVVVDEGDSVLLDEAGNPLVMGERIAKGLPMVTYVQIYLFAKSLIENEDYTLDRLHQGVTFHETAISQMQKKFVTNRLAAAEIENLLRQAIVIREFFHRGSEYVIQEGEIVLVDEFTGRLKRTHVLGNHQHQLIAAMEKVENGEEIQVVPGIVPAQLITYASYYQRAAQASRFSIITGTMGNETAEIRETYGLDFVRIPIQFSSQLINSEKNIFETKNEKDSAILEEILRIHKKGNPILIFVRRISDAENWKIRLASELALTAEVIDGLYPEMEKDLIAKAGEKGRITIATNTAGRGTNIPISSEVEALGGLHVIQTRRHKSKRIDDQQRLRTARRGMPGENHLFLSKEDESFSRFGDQDRSEDYLRIVRQRIQFFDRVLDPYRRHFYEKREKIIERPDENRQELERNLSSLDQAWKNYLTRLEILKYRAAADVFENESERLFEPLKLLLEEILGSPVMNGMPRSEVREAAPHDLKPKPALDSFRGTFLIKGDLLARLTAEQKKELFARLFLNRKQIRLIVFGDHGQIPEQDPAIRGILQLARLTAEPSYEAASKKYGIPNGRSIVFLTPEEKHPFRAQPFLKGVLLKNQPGEFLFAEYLIKGNAPFGVSEENGIYDPPSAALTVLGRQMASIVIAYSA